MNQPNHSHPTSAAAQQAQPDPQTAAQVVPGNLLLPFVLVTGLFALWGFANDITAPVVKAFKNVLQLSNFESALVLSAFYGGYCLMAIPAALFLQRFNYKAGILTGLGLYAAGCLLFLPAGWSLSFWAFLVAYFVMTCGLSFLETTSNPYILSMGPQETATRRLNFAQAFNPIGAISGILVARHFILSKLEVRDADALTLLQKSGDAGAAAAAKIDTTHPYGEEVRIAIRDNAASVLKTVKEADIDVIVWPYLILGLVVSAIFVFFLFAKLPAGSVTGAKLTWDGIRDTVSRLARNGAYVQGVITQAFYVGVQIMCWVFISYYAEKVLKMPIAVAADFFLAAMVMFVTSRFVCTYLLKFVSPGGLLSTLAIGGVACVLGAIFLPNAQYNGSWFGPYYGLYSLLAVSACMSLMFPTIYGIALRGLGDNDAKLASAGLIVAIGGGAVFPPIQGWIMDELTEKDVLWFGVIDGMRASFVVPLICFVVIAAYGLRTKLVHHAK